MEQYPTYNGAFVSSWNSNGSSTVAYPCFGPPRTLQPNPCFGGPTMPSTQAAHWNSPPSNQPGFCFVPAATLRGHHAPYRTVQQKYDPCFY